MNKINNNLIKILPLSIFKIKFISTSNIVNGPLNLAKKQSLYFSSNILVAL